jgi:acid phosphatase
MVVLENADASVALGQPFFAELAGSGAFLAQSRAVARPSQPNYIALTSGGIWGVDSNDAHTLDVRHLGDLLEESGKDWRVYAEDYPGGCFLEDANGHYRRKHVPFLSYRSVQQDVSRCAKIVPAGQFRQDLASSSLPEFSLYVPNNRHNGHDTDVAAADRWLRDTFGELIKDSVFMSQTLLIVTYDEPGKDGTQPIYTALVGAGIRPGARSGTCYDHYNMLRTIEEVLGLGTLGAGDQRVSPIGEIWSTPAATSSLAPGGTPSSRDGRQILG